MKRIFTLYLFILFCLILQAQEELYERVYVHTDKTCYLAGEEVWLKFYTIDTHFRPSSFSKVGYIEISNTERPKAQLKLALDNGSGSGKVKIPTDAPSGIYELTGYTRYMRNEGEKVFFRKSIAVINTFRVSDSDPIELADSAEIYRSLQISFETRQTGSFNERKIDVAQIVIYGTATGMGSL